MKAKFQKSEKLYRGVRNNPKMIKRDGTISRAAFTYTGANNGCSVCRQMKRSNDEAIKHTLSCLKGHADVVASITVEKAKQVDIYIKYSPSYSNTFHSELFADNHENKLNDEQLDFLASNVLLEKYS